MPESVPCGLSYRWPIYDIEEKWSPLDADDLLEAGYDRLKIFIPPFRYLLYDLKEEADEEIGRILHP